MTSTADLDVSTAAHLFADRSRSRVVRALMDGRALPASRLAEEASVSPQTVSSHLAQLLAAGFVTVEQSGRHRYYALAGPEVACMDWTEQRHHLAGALGAAVSGPSSTGAGWPRVADPGS